MAKERLSDDDRRFIAERAGGRCEYCRSPESHSNSPFCIEHVTPESRGGATALDNLAWSCLGCNLHKYTKTEGFDPVTGTTVALFNPRTQQWRDHFIWSHDAAEIRGLTATGRATVIELHLNHPAVVNLRRALFAIGQHPPADL